jgi:hypothetical protein
MRKSRIKFTDLDEELIEMLEMEPESFFEYIEELAIKIPSWSKLFLVAVAPLKQALEINFFEEAQEFFLSYTKKVLRYSSSIDFICFSREMSEEWKIFLPPTLIGADLTTRLRKKN